MKDQEVVHAFHQPLNARVCIIATVRHGMDHCLFPPLPLLVAGGQLEKPTAFLQHIL